MPHPARAAALAALLLALTGCQYVYNGAPHLVCGSDSPHPVRAQTGKCESATPGYRWFVARPDRLAPEHDVGEGQELPIVYTEAQR